MTVKMVAYCILSTYSTGVGYKHLHGYVTVQGKSYQDTAGSNWYRNGEMNSHFQQIREGLVKVL